MLWMVEYRALLLTAQHLERRDEFWENEHHTGFIIFSHHLYPFERTVVCLSFILNFDIEELKINLGIKLHF